MPAASAASRSIAIAISTGVLLAGCGSSSPSKKSTQASTPPAQKTTTTAASTTATTPNTSTTSTTSQSTRSDSKHSGKSGKHGSTTSSGRDKTVSIPLKPKSFKTSVAVAARGLLLKSCKTVSAGKDTNAMPTLQRVTSYLLTAYHLRPTKPYNLSPKVTTTMKSTLQSLGSALRHSCGNRPAIQKLGTRLRRAATKSA